MAIEIFASLGLGIINRDFKKGAVMILILIYTFSNLGAVELTPSLREEYYEKAGMGYAKLLWQKQDGSNDDEKRNRTAEGLSYQVRARAVKMTEAQLERSKNNPRIKQEIYVRLGNLEEQQAESISRKGENNPGLFKQHIENAIKWQKQCLKEFPKYKADEILFSLAENYARLTDTKQAEKYYTDLVEHYPQSSLVSDALLAVGNIHFDRKSYAQARKYFGRILAARESNLFAYAHYKIAWCLFNESKPAEAMASLESAVRSSRQLGDAKTQRSLGVEDEALSDLVLFFSEYSNPRDAKAYFDNIAEKSRARELRIMLAKRYYDQGQHENSKLVARDLLAENIPPKEQGQLQLILLSVAEKTKDYALSIKAAQDLSQWILSLKANENENVKTDAEEYLKGFCFRAHYAAETLKRRELWPHAKMSYETFIKTFPDSKDIAEVEFRYGGLLFQMKQNRESLPHLNTAIGKFAKDSPRLKEAMQLRIQTIEQADKVQRKEIADTDLIKAYDEFAGSYPQDSLAPEALFKSAEIAKKLETPELASLRFKKIAEAYPQHKLANAAISNSLSLLVQSEKWDAVKLESVTLANKTDDQALRNKITEAKELAEAKIVENLEHTGKYKEASEQYLKLASADFSTNFKLMCTIKAAKIQEQNLKDLTAAISTWKFLQDNFSSAKESHLAHLEIARLSEQLAKPEDAIASYLAYANNAKDEASLKALTNAAVLEEKLKLRTKAGDHFLQLSQAITTKPKESLAALEAACNNYLLGIYQKDGNAELEKLKSCSNSLAKASDDVRWKARQAWAEEKLGNIEEANQLWTGIGKAKTKNISDEVRPYIAIGKFKRLEGTLNVFRELRFTKSNENPNNNLAKKTKGMEALEKEVNEVLEIASPRIQVLTHKILQSAYLEFAETLEQANTPKNLGEADKEQMKASFQTAAKQLREKAEAMKIPELVAERQPASSETTLDPVAFYMF